MKFIAIQKARSCLMKIPRMTSERGRQRDRKREREREEQEEARR